MDCCWKVPLYTHDDVSYDAIMGRQEDPCDVFVTRDSLSVDQPFAAYKRNKSQRDDDIEKGMFGDSILRADALFI